MPASMPDVPAGTTNAELIESLRAAAEWLEAHPELPPFNGYLVYTAIRGEDCREVLSTVARAHDDPTEQIEYGNDVVIRASIGRVGVRASTSLTNLAPSVPPSPRYDRILDGLR